MTGPIEQLRADGSDDFAAAVRNGGNDGDVDTNASRIVQSVSFCKHVPTVLTSIVRVIGIVIFGGMRTIRA